MAGGFKGESPRDAKGGERWTDQAVFFLLNDQLSFQPKN